MANPVLLIVDDNADLLKQLQRDLERRYGEQYRVITASSGRAALTTLQQLKKKNDRVALILVDQRLPDMPAGEFLDQAHALFNDAKIVFLTTVGESEATIGAIKKFHVDDYLIKPCQPPDQNLYPAVNDLLADWEARVSVEGLRVIGSRFSSEAHQIRDFLVRNCIPFEWLDVDRDKEEMRRILNVSELESSRLPVVVFPDGTRQTRPTNAEIAQKIGLKIRPEGEFYDLIIVGGGPSGLAAAVYGASEGLHTIIVERHAPGGQAGLSSMIENYLGFPAGLSGTDLARRAVAQAKKFEVEIVSPLEVSGVRVKGSTPIATLSDGSELEGPCCFDCHWSRMATPECTRDRSIGRCGSLLRWHFGGSFFLS